MVVKTYVTLDDVLGISNYPGQIKGQPTLSGSDKARIIYEAFNKWSIDSFSSEEIEENYNISKSTVNGWKGGRKPKFIKDIDALIERGLLPLTDESTYLNLISFLWLQTLLTGQFRKNSENSYTLIINDDKGLLREKKEFLETVGIKISPNRYDNNYTITSINQHEDSIAPGLVKLFRVMDFPVGKKYEIVNLGLPEFIDSFSLVYYVFRLRGTYHKDKNEYFARLWWTYEENAEHNKDLFLSKMKETGFDFTASVTRGTTSNQGSNYEGFYPIIRLSKKSEVKQLHNLLIRFEPKLID